LAFLGYFYVSSASNSISAAASLKTPMQELITHPRPICCDKGLRIGQYRKGEERE